VLVTERNKVLWRNSDPVTDLLGRGVLVIDSEEHDHYRALMEPSLHPSLLSGFKPMMIEQTDRVSSMWKDSEVVDMLVESRKIALLIIMQALFSTDVWDDLSRIWTPILQAIKYISPGVWILWRRMPRLGYKKHLRTLDNYLFEMIGGRRKNKEGKHDLLQHLIDAGLSDEVIRDQMLTMLIAGHDTSTALLAWTFYLLGSNLPMMAQLDADLEMALRGGPPPGPGGWQPPFLDQVIKEALRLFPPIHIGNRVAAAEIDLGAQAPIRAGEPFLYSIYLSHRDDRIWNDADLFRPERFINGPKVPPFAYLPFGAGPRACVGAAFAQAEARIVIARLLQTFRFELIDCKVRAHLGATLEPRPGVLMRVWRKRCLPCASEVS
jgi:cytochrome P450